MRKYFEEIVIFILQLVIFYVFPLVAVDNGAKGMLIIIILATFIAAVGFGGISKYKIKYYYPILTAILFIPAVYIYNTEFDFIDVLWCLASASLGVLIGDIIMHK